MHPPHLWLENWWESESKDSAHKCIFGGKNRHSESKKLAQDQHANYGCNGAICLLCLGEHVPLKLNFMALVHMFTIAHRSTESDQRWLRRFPIQNKARHPYKIIKRVTVDLKDPKVFHPNKRIWQSPRLLSPTIGYPSILVLPCASPMTKMDRTWMGAKRDCSEAVEKMGAHVIRGLE